VGSGVIPEPHRTYVLELLKALGPAADEFVVAGAQAMKFVLERARGTKDLDFVLDVVRLRGENLALAKRLKDLGYGVVEGARNFQFEKRIPNSNEVMRIEFMAPEEFKREKDFRVEVEKGIHARACTGGSIAISESSVHPLSGKLPDGSPFSASIRVTKAHALVMLKLLALDDRYRNIRGTEEAKHDREEARTHAADIISVIAGQKDPGGFKVSFQQQFQADPNLGVHVLELKRRYFGEITSPGLLVYEEFVVADRPLDRDARRQVTAELERAHGMMVQLLPPKQFYELAGAIRDCCDIEGNRGLTEEFLSTLEQTRTGLLDKSAIAYLPGSAFGGAFKRGDTFTTNAGEALKALSTSEVALLDVYLDLCARKLRQKDLIERFPHALTVEGR
jgi:hypothetical protein